MISHYLFVFIFIVYKTIIYFNLLRFHFLMENIMIIQTRSGSCLLIYILFITLAIMWKRFRFFNNYSLPKARGVKFSLFNAFKLPLLFMKSTIIWGFPEWKAICKGVFPFKHYWFTSAPKLRRNLQNYSSAFFAA